MTNKEAFEILKTEWDINAEIFDANFHEALAIAIKALEESPQGDMISREALKKHKVYSEERHEYVVPVYTIDNAPTVEPKLKDDIIEAFNLITDQEFEYSDSFWIATPKGKKIEFEKKRPQGEWIPVSERLPEEKYFNPSGSDFGFDFGEVLCTTIWGDVRAYKFGKPIGQDKPHFWLGGGIMDEYIIAWQYKPKPYKKGCAE